MRKLKDIIVNIDNNTNEIKLNNTNVGVDGENLVSRLVFKFSDKFIDGYARVEYLKDTEKNYINIDKENDTYVLPINNVLTKRGTMYLQLIITEEENDFGIPIFKSKKFPVIISDSINAVDEAPKGYDDWITKGNALFLKLENSEKIRVSQEKNREEQENKRSSNETERKENEIIRIENEDVRCSNESIRCSSEQLRIENESSRVSNEAIRNSSEQARLTSELERKANELVREEYINQLKQNVEDGKFDGECNFATFNINVETGNLEMNKTDDLLLDFKIENGNLEVLI